ncbi:MAG TPA: DPP IV N-terminal domain-containing protein [Gemmatimonadaceae bacterium]|jgi:Periplasmic component of the Tol biopolymer transport system
MKITIPLRATGRAAAVLAILVALAACDDNNNGIGPDVGSVTVSVTSTGAGVSSLGYLVTLDGGVGEPVAANGDVSVSAAAGTHSVELTQVGSNCTVAGENPRTVTVIAGEDAAVTFEVTCVARQIAFASDRSGSFAIYSLSEDGTGLTRLTNDAAPLFAILPAWSPDGSRIAFSSSRQRSTVGLDIWVMEADGSGQERLTDSPGQNGGAAWSHDGTRIAFASTRGSATGATAEIWIMNADGSNQVQLTNDGAFANTPSWSPDDSKIVFQSNRDGNDQLYVMNADGSGIQRLTTGTSSDQAPSWSPDGALIAFHSDRDNTMAADSANFEVYVINADGSGSPVRLTDNASFDGRASWSPDGSEILFDTRRDGNQDVYVMKRDGSGQVNITRNAAGDGFARFQP